MVDVLRRSYVMVAVAVGTIRMLWRAKLPRNDRFPRITDAFSEVLRHLRLLSAAISESRRGTQQLLFVCLLVYFPWRACTVYFLTFSGVVDTTSRRSHYLRSSIWQYGKNNCVSRSLGNGFARSVLVKEQRKVRRYCFNVLVFLCVLCFSCIVSWRAFGFKIQRALTHQQAKQGKLDFSVSFANFILIMFGILRMKDRQKIFFDYQYYDIHFLLLAMIYNYNILHYKQIWISSSFIHSGMTIYNTTLYKKFNIFHLNLKITNIAKVAGDEVVCHVSIPLMERNYFPSS